MTYMLLLKCALKLVEKIITDCDVGGLEQIWLLRRV